MLIASNEPQATKKFFGAAIFQKCCRGVGEQPTFAKQIVFAVCFSCCNCIFWNCPIQIKLNCENQDCKFRQGNGAIAARWQAKAGVEPPFAGCERPFSLREVLLGKPHESGSARLGHIPSLPWESQLPLKPCLSLQPF